MINSRTKNIFKQVLALWCFWIIIRLFLTSSAENIELFFIQSMFSLVCFVIVIVLNVSYLIPKFFIPKKYFLYGSLSIGVIGASLFLVYFTGLPWGNWYDSNTEYLHNLSKLGPSKNRSSILPKLAPLIIAFLGSSVIEVMQYANKKENEFIEAEKEKLKTELKFLKSQVNPHFLFNALNNIYSLSITKSERTSESIMQLSEILRYMVYDSRESKVELKSEINYINNYIELIRLKDSRGLDIQVDIDNQSPQILIAPLLFIPFIENAFKHSEIENIRNGFVHIKLKVNEENVELRVVNSIPENSFTKDQIGGVGLENTKKRLSLLYPDNEHQLTINITKSSFEIVLKIQH